MLVNEQRLNRGMQLISLETNGNVVAYDYETFESITLVCAGLLF